MMNSFSSDFLQVVKLVLDVKLSIERKIELIYAKGYTKEFAHYLVTSKIIKRSDLKKVYSKC
jgi:hypothetical protein